MSKAQCVEGSGFEIPFVKQMVKYDTLHMGFRQPAVYVKHSDIHTQVIYGLGNLQVILRDEFLYFVHMSRRYSG